MERIRQMFIAAAFMAAFTVNLGGCVPMAADGTNAGLQFEPGSSCAGHEGQMFVCAEGGTQRCWPDGTASECTEMACMIPSGLPALPDVDGGECATNEWEYCPASDGSVGVRLCNVSGMWQECISCGRIYRPDGGMPMDAGTGCDSDPLIGTSCTVGTGTCAADGEWACVGGVRECVLNPGEAVGMPTSETCDNLDNDCDGMVDEAVTQTCYGGPAGTRGVGQCVAGTQVCTAGTWGACTGEVLPGTEVPDNDVDEDCNGGLLFSVSCGGDPRDGTACTAGIGVCMDTGTWDCRGNELFCDAIPGTPVSELCDNLDNDCDGLVDESLLRSFYTGPAGTAMVGICRVGYDRCAAGVWTLDSPEVLPMTEVCGDGTDQDCNGHDDACPTCGGDPRITTPPTACSVGLGLCAASGDWACDTGVVRCTASPGAAADELCDNLDNDCDGATDEDLVQTCYSGDMRQAGLGICRMGMRACSAGLWGACMGEVLPAAEVCGDDVDQDCNGSDLRCGTSCGSDPRIDTSCTTGVGACERTGIYQCTSGTVTCSAVAGMPVAETCNGTDDNCNRVIDEAPGGGPLTQSCYPFATGRPGVGVCRNGTQTCSAGAFGTCTGAVGPSAEICDGLDNDCDGGADEGGVCGSSGADAGTGTMADAGAGAMTDAGTGTDAGMPSGVSATGYATWIDPSIPLSTWCPSGGTLEVRVWDNIDNDVPNVTEMHYEPQPLVVPIGSAGVALTGSYTNDTLYCRTGSGTYMGYYSPRLRDATNGATCASIGVRKYIDGSEIPCFICWDTQYAGSSDPRSTDFRRTQTRLTPDVSAHTACMSGTLTP